MSLHNEIMNLPCDPSHANDEFADRRFAYKFGHRDARHAAADLALKADAEIAQLKAERDALEEQLRTTIQALDGEADLLARQRDALLKDAERMAWLAANTQWDCYGYWLPEICIELREPEEGEPAFPTREDFNAAIDAAMASSSKGGK